MTITKHAPAPASIEASPAHANHILRRGVAILGLLAIALIHVEDATGKFHETPYLGWLYVALVIGALVVAALLTEGNDRRIWMGALVVSVLALTGYVLSRTTGLPSATEDKGNWFEPLGLATIFSEVVVIACSIRALQAEPSHAPLDAPVAPTKRPAT